MKGTPASQFPSFTAASKVLQSSPSSMAPTLKAANLNSAIDDRVLKDMFDDEAFIHILHSFIGPARSIVKEIQVAYESESSNAVMLASHKLKSAALTIGAKELGELSSDLEQAGKEDDWETINCAVPRLDDLMLQIESYISAL